MRFIKAGELAELGPGQTKPVKVDGHFILLVNWEGSIFALGGLCPHQGLPLDGARVWNFILDCPWHHFQYDVRTGENTYPGKVYPKSIERLQQQVQPVRKYEVRVDNGEILIAIG